MTDNPKTALKIKPSIEESLQRLEFYRDGLALVPALGDKHPGTADFTERKNNSSVIKYRKFSQYQL